MLLSAAAPCRGARRLRQQLPRALLLCAALAFAAPARAQAGARPAATPQAQCSADNRETLAALTEALEAARKRSLLNPVLVSRLQTYETQLARLRDTLKRNARTVAECEQGAAQIEAERERLVRLVGPEGVPAAAAAAAAAASANAGSAAVDACRAGNVDAYGDASRAWREGAAARGLKAGDEEFDAAMLRLRRLRDDLARTGGGLPECEALGRAIAQEQAKAPQAVPRALPAPAAVPTPAPAPAPALAPATAAPPVAAAADAPAECAQLNSQTHADLVQRLAALMQAARVPAESLGPYRALGQRLTALDQRLAAAPGAADCPRLSLALSEAGAELQRLSGLATSTTSSPVTGTTFTDAQAASLQMPSARSTDPRADKCSADLRLNFLDVQQLANSLGSRRELVAAGRAQLKRMLQALALQQVMLFSRDLLSLEDCQQLVQTVGDLRAQVQQVMSTYAQASAQPQAAAPPPAANGLAPQRQQALAAPTPPAAPTVRQGPDPQVLDCVGRNRQAHGEVLQVYQNLQRSGRISAQESAEFQQLQARLSEHAGSLARDGLSLAECQNIGNGIRQLHAAVQRMGQGDPRLDACRGQVRQAQAELVQNFQSQQRGGRISAQEAGEFQNLNGRASQMVQAVARDGASFQDCQQTAQFIHQAQGAVQRMGQVDPRIEQCKAQLRQSYGEAQQLLQAAARSRMTPQKMQELQRSQGRLNQLGNAAQHDFTSLQECQGVGNGLAQERGNLQSLAR